MQIIAEVDSKFKIQKEEKNTFKTYHTAHVSDHKGQGHPFQLVCLTSSCLKRQIVENRQKTDKEAWLIVKSEVQCSLLRKSTITRGATTSEVYLIQTEFM